MHVYSSKQATRLEKRGIMHIVRTFGHITGATLLVSGTAIGVGMLALPLASAQGGFFPALVIYTVCWLFMMATGLLILEACIWMPKDANLVTLSSHLLGKWGKRSCWALYIFLFTCLMVAHIAGGGSVVNQITHLNIPPALACLVYVLIFAPAVYLGTRAVDRLNLLLMLGIAVTYLTFVFSSADDVQSILLTRTDWWAGWAALPVVFTAFGYQNLIPTLMTYMNRDVKKVRFAIIVGTFIPFVIYIIWALIILGIIPAEGQGGLLDALSKGQNAVAPLSNFLKNPILYKIGIAFAFFALTTSFVGISVAYMDFLADGLHVKNKNWIHKLGLCAIVFGLPLIVTWIDPHIFLQALNVAGGLGAALLLGLMPILMVWIGRYYKGHSLLHQQVPGGKITLSILMVFLLFEFGIEFFS